MARDTAQPRHGSISQSTPRGKTPHNPLLAPPPATAGRALSGGVAGLAATVPMTLVMKVLERRLPSDERLPSAQEPLLIVDQLLRAVGVEQELSERQKRRLTWGAHFGYGTASGIGYAFLAGRLPLPTATRGALYGVLLWALSYGGWLPALRILPLPTRRALGRNAVLIASHLVWGVSASLVYERATGPKPAI